MQVGGHRRRRGHRARQPEVEGELRRLGEGPQQDQKQRRQVKGRALDRLALGDDLGQAVRSRDLPQHQAARDHGKAACRGHGQRHARALAPFGQVLPETDQQERGQGGQFPEDQHHQDVVGQHDARHRALEQHQVGKERPRRVAFGQVEARVKDDQQPDPQDQDAEQKAKPVQHEIRVQPDLRHPGQAGGGDLACQNGGDVQKQAQGREGGDGPAGDGGGAAARTDHEARQQGAQERQDGDQGWGHGLLRFGGGSQARRRVSST